MPAADRLATTTDMLRLRLLRSPLPGWWRDVRADLLSLLPPRWRARVAGQRRQLWLLPEGDDLVVALNAADGTRELGRVPRDPELLQALQQRAGSSISRTWARAND